MADFTKALTQSIVKLCGTLEDILKDETLSPKDRAEVEGVKKAMERMGFKGKGGREK